MAKSSFNSLICFDLGKGNLKWYELIHFFIYLNKVHINKKDIKHLGTEKCPIKWFAGNGPMVMLLLLVVSKSVRMMWQPKVEFLTLLATAM